MTPADRGQGGRMRGWIVLYCFGRGNDILPNHYKTEKMAQKFAAEHRARGCEAVVINVEDLVAWINSGVDELERMFKL